MSLYPSAMVRLYRFLKGKPKVLKDLSMEFLNSCDGYFIEIKITKIGKKRAFPITNFKNRNGVRLSQMTVKEEQCTLIKLHLKI